MLKLVKIHLYNVILSAEFKIWFDILSNRIIWFIMNIAIYDHVVAKIKKIREITFRRISQLYPKLICGRQGCGSGSRLTESDPQD